MAWYLLTQRRLHVARRSCAPRPARSIATCSRGGSKRPTPSSSAGTSWARPSARARTPPSAWAFTCSPSSGYGAPTTSGTDVTRLRWGQHPRAASARAVAVCRAPGGRQDDEKDVRPAHPPRGGDVAAPAAPQHHPALRDHRHREPRPPRTAPPSASAAPALSAALPN